MADDFKSWMERETRVESPENMGPAPTGIDYDEKYDPSAIQGALGIGALGAAGYLFKKKFPFAKFLNKLDKIEAPKIPQAPRATTPIQKDVVDEIIDVVPTKIERGRETALTVNKSVTGEIVSESERVRKKVNANPLTMGGKKPNSRFNSALYDYIASNKIGGARPATEWIKEFEGNAMNNFRFKNDAFKSVRGNISKEELFDSNIAIFDNNGKIVGGFLKKAQDEGMKVTKMDLLNLVEKNPANNFVIKRYRVTRENTEEAEKLAQSLINASSQITQRIRSAISNNPEATSRAGRLTSLMSNIDYEPYRELAKITRGMRNNTEGGLNRNYFADLESYLDDLKIVQQEINQEFVSPTQLDAIKAGIRNLRLKIQAERAQGLSPKYGNYQQYRQLGGEEYIEDVVHYPKSFPGGDNASANHYDDLKNQLYHIRYAKRSLEGNPNQKVYAIDEIQSDIQQSAMANDPFRKKVINPISNDFSMDKNVKTILEIRKRMDEIARKGAAITPQERMNFYKLKQEFDTIKDKTVNLATYGDSSLKLEQIKRGEQAYMPMFEADVWGDHAVKNLLKSAAEDGVDWVVVNPVNRIHAVKRRAALGDADFYGFENGKAGKRGIQLNKYKKDPATGKKTNKDEIVKSDPKKIAVIPNRMKKIADQYNSQAKTIRISKSDPSKPFKVVRDVDNFYSEEKRLSFNKLNPGDDGTEHLAAFKTEREAKLFAELGEDGGRVVKMESNDPNLYYEAFGIKVTPEMKGTPFKLYKKEGGLVVNLFA